MGKVEGPIRYRPDGLTFIPFINEGQISRIVDLFKMKGESFNIKDVKSDRSDLECKIIPVKDGRGYVLVAVWLGEKTKEMKRGMIQVFTTDKEQSQIDIPYTVFPARAKPLGR